MKKTLNLTLALLLPAVFCLAAAAQESALPGETAAAAQKPAEAAAAPKKAVKKKKTTRKKAKKPASEYKFEAVEKTHTYKFDKDAAPITKDKKSKAKKASKKKAGKKAAKKAKKARSQYKFEAVEKTHTYKLDKNADPIIKESKKKKKAAPKKPAEAPREGWGGEASGAVTDIN